MPEASDNPYRAQDRDPDTMFQGKRIPTPSHWNNRTDIATGPRHFRCE